MDGIGDAGAMGVVSGAGVWRRPAAALANYPAPQDAGARTGRAGGDFAGDWEPGSRPANAGEIARGAAGPVASAAGAASGGAQEPEAGREEEAEGRARGPRRLRR